MFARFSLYLPPLVHTLVALAVSTEGRRNTLHVGAEVSCEKRVPGYLIPYSVFQ